MSLAQPAYSLKNVRLTMSNGDSRVVNISIQRKILYAKKKIGSALVASNVYMGEDDPDITCTAVTDEVNNPATLIPNTSVTGLALTSNQDTNAAFLASDFLTKFPYSGWVVADPGVDLDGEKLSEMKWKFVTNVLNPGVNGGYSYTPPT